MNRPWLKFYPADWRADPRLRMCSLAARGLWIDLMSYMHEGEPYGHLTIDGIPPSTSGIAALVGRPVNEVVKAIAELEARRVFDRAENGAIVSRRMVRDKIKEKKDRENGKGGGNPKLMVPDNGGVNPPDKAQKLEAREDDGGEDAREREPLLGREAIEIANEVAGIVGHNLEFLPPGWCGAPLTVQKWLTNGYQREVILSTIKEVMGKKRDGPPATITYFERPIAVAVARLDAPLPTVKVVEQQEVIDVRRTQAPGGVIAAADRLLERMRAFDEPAPSERGVRDGAGAAPLRAIPKG